MNGISDTDSTSSSARISDINKNTVEVLEPTMKGQIYMKGSKVKNIDEHTKEEPTIRFWDKINKNNIQKDYLHNML